MSPAVSEPRKVMSDLSADGEEGLKCFLPLLCSVYTVSVTHPYLRVRAQSLHVSDSLLRLGLWRASALIYRPSFRLQNMF